TAPHPCARSCRGGRDARPFAANSPGGGAFVVGAVFIAATPPHRTHSYRMATETTKSIEDQLRALIRLQYIDSRIDQIHKMQENLPEEIHDLEDEKAGLETRIEKAQRDAQEGEVQRKKLKLDIAESEGLIRKYEEQQLQVRNNREYDALTKEIEA